MKKINNKNYLITKNKIWVLLIFSLIFVELAMCASIIAINLIYPNLKGIVAVLIIIFTLLLAVTIIIFALMSKQFKKAMRMEDKISANINDDILNPLCTIRSNLQIALSCDNKDKTEEIICDTLQEANNLTSLMDRLMLIRDAYFGNLDYNFEKSSINNFIETLILPYNEYAELQNKSISITESQVYEPIYFDKDKLREILKNLLDNAFKYTKPNDKITLNFSLYEDNLIIKVIDSGIGVSEYEINEIFEKFYQTKNGKVINPSGNGLGLTVAQLLVKGMNGSLTAEKNFPKGMKFTISLPCKKYNTF